MKVENPAVVQAQEQSKWWVLFAIGMGTFMAALDGSVVNTVLPVISGFFETGIAQIQWVVTVYMLVLSGLLLSFGRLGDMRGHKRVYLMGFGVFVAASALCGIAPNAPALIAFRALQALGAAMLSANSPAILTKTFPSAQRGQALGLMATMTYLGLTVGPSLGGWLTFNFSWRWVFYINIPVGLLAIWLSLRHVPNDRGSEALERFDLAGAGAFMVGLVALLFGLNQGYIWGWLSAPILGLLGGAAALLGIFIYLERTVPHPMLDLSLFRVNLFSVSVLSAVLNYICVFSVIFLLPFYLIQGRGLSPAEAGLLLTAQPIVMALVAPISGSLSDKVGARPLTILGMAILAAGLLYMSQLGSGSSHIQIISGLAVVGLGTGIFISPNNSALMGSAPRHRQGIAAGILATARNMGMALGVGISGAIFTTILARGEAAGSTDTLFIAFSTSFLVASGIAALGALVLIRR
jgi:EmrB/QacA subfamily drug resistance transporter